MAGMSHAVLVIEAELRSGTLITSRIATEYARDVFAVPGNIASETSAGPHMLIQKGALLVHSSNDIIEALGVETCERKETQRRNVPPEEQRVLDALIEPLPRDALVARTGMSVSEANVLLSAMELKGLIAEKMGHIEATS